MINFYQRPCCDIKQRFCTYLGEVKLLIIRISVILKYILVSSLYLQEEMLNAPKIIMLHYNVTFHVLLVVWFIMLFEYTFWAEFIHLCPSMEGNYMYVP